jgi:hypothetical protein
MSIKGHNNAGLAVKAPTPLDRISAAADRIERLAFTVEEFNDRFYNGTPEQIGLATCRPVPSGHDGQIGRLHDAIERLDAAAQRLQTIG